MAIDFENVDEIVWIEHVIPSQINLKKSKILSTLDHDDSKSKSRNI